MPACRLPASAAENQTDRYDLSLKDMSYMGHIRELEEFGAASFKIEGRMKRPEYVACVWIRSESAERKRNTT